MSRYFNQDDHDEDRKNLGIGIGGNENDTIHIICDDLTGNTYLIKISEKIFKEKNKKEIDEEMKENEKDQNFENYLSFKIVPFKKVEKSTDDGKNLLLFSKNDTKKPCYSYLLFHGDDKNRFDEFDVKKNQWKKKSLPKNLSNVQHAFNFQCVCHQKY